MTITSNGTSKRSITATKFSIRSRAAGALAVIALLSTASAGTIAAHDGEDHNESKLVSLGYKESAYSDARLIAKANRLEVGTALRFAEGSRVFADFASTISGKYPSFAIAVYAENPGEASVLKFKGTVPEAVKRQVAELGMKIRLVGGAKYDAAGMEAFNGKIHNLLLDAGWSQVVTSATPAQTIEATVYSKGGEAKLPKLPISVKVSVSNEPIAEDHHTRGGGNVLNSTGFRICTSGFSVIKDGVTGISTSGHCDTMDQFQEPDTLITYESDSEDSHYGFWGDYQWQSTPTHFDLAEYFARANEIRDVNSVSGLLPVNTPTCSFGRTTLVRNCDEVYSNSVIATFSGPTHFFLMANDNNFSSPGDSGGPISFGTEADGLNKGSMTLGGARRQVWVRGGLMPAAIGASIMTK
jgi:hypothetical protein